MWILCPTSAPSIDSVLARLPGERPPRGGQPFDHGRRDTQPYAPVPLSLLGTDQTGGACQSSQDMGPMTRIASWEYFDGRLSNASTVPQTRTSSQNEHSEEVRFNTSFGEPINQMWNARGSVAHTSKEQFLTSNLVSKPGSALVYMKSNHSVEKTIGCGNSAQEQNVWKVTTSAVPQPELEEETSIFEESYQELNLPNISAITVRGIRIFPKEMAASVVNAMPIDGQCSWNSRNELFQSRQPQSYDFMKRSAMFVRQSLVNPTNVVVQHAVDTALKNWLMEKRTCYEAKNVREKKMACD